MKVTLRKHYIRAEVEYGVMVAMCGRSVPNRALVDDHDKIDCYNCLRAIAKEKRHHE